MKTKTEILSRKEASCRIGKCSFENTAVISFYDPVSSRTPKGYAPLDYSKVCKNVFYVPVHDIDIEILPDYGLTFETYFPEAEALARFIAENVAAGRKIICQCEYGQSRSAACAAAVLEYYDKCGIDIFADYRYYPNQLIFNKLLTALKRQKERESE